MRTRIPEPPSSEITPPHVYLNRRAFIKNAALTLGTATAVGGGLLYLVGQSPPPDPTTAGAAPAPDAGAGSGAVAGAAVSGDIQYTKNTTYDTTEGETSLRDITSY